MFKVTNTGAMPRTNLGRFLPVNVTEHVWVFLGASGAEAEVETVGN